MITIEISKQDLNLALRASNQHGQFWLTSGGGVVWVSTSNPSRYVMPIQAYNRPLFHHLLYAFLPEDFVSMRPRKIAQYLEDNTPPDVYEKALNQVVTQATTNLLNQARSKGINLIIT